MYALYIEFDDVRLFMGEANSTRDRAYTIVNAMLNVRGFSRLGYSYNLYIGNSSVDAESCVLALEDICCANTGFTEALVEAKMFQIESLTDLLPKVGLS